MVLVAVAMVAIIAMAALSIDVITLYLAKQEAQRSADAAALAAAKVLSLSGITGDPTQPHTQLGRICGPDDGTNGVATRVAKAVANQNTLDRRRPRLRHSNRGTTHQVARNFSDCTALNTTASA